MSGSAGGEIVVLAVGAAAVASVVVVAGCAYGLAKTAQFLVSTMDEAWEAHERIAAALHAALASSAGPFPVAMPMSSVGG